MAETRTSAKSSATRKSSSVMSDLELDAMKETLKERKKSAKLSPEEQRIEGEKDVLAKIAEMPEDDRKIATRIHAIVGAAGPDLVPRTFYGMPAWSKDGKVIGFFQSKSKFKVRYCTLGFQPDALLDDGDMWPCAFAIVRMDAATEKRIAALIKKAAGG
jgi:uncharacterized protein YdhG (YjbR/CyaY superfamily)